MSGPDIAAEVAAALAEAAAAVGTGPYICTLRRASTEPDEPQTPWDEPADPVNPPQLFAVTAVEDMREVRDMTGALIGVTKRTLTIDATGVVPLKSDQIAVGVAPADVDANIRFEEILSVRPLSPAGVALLYELDLSA